MPDSTYTELFHFASAALPPETFHVVRFRGTEGLNRLFSFSIDLVSQDSSVDADKVLDAPALFTIHRQSGGDAVFQGFPARVEQSGHFNGWTYYQVELRPAFWKLTQLVQSAIFLDKTARDAADELLGGQQFFNIPHEFRFTRSDYPAQEFAMQYGESVYDYILWRMEEQGAYFFFAPDGDKIIFADSPQSHDAPSITVSYSPATGLEGEKREEVLTAFTMARTPLPRRVVVRTYDWKDPLKVVLGMADVAAGGMGDVYLTSENVENDAEAERIAKIRAEELICRSRQFSGAGAVSLLRPGLVFTLERHYNPAFNRGYMVTEITHEGGQEAFLSLGLGIPLRDAAEHLFYRNSFSCIEDDLPYRPARTAPRASIPGVIRAFVDGAGSGARAEMDEYGRYKLIFPFDVSGRKAGNASCWVRMAQPQVGMDHGMSFPLLPGAEVTVAFLNGNPDRPVITGALPNGETGAITGQGNVNFSGIRTPGGNQLTFNDTDNKQGISLLSASGLGLSFADGSPNTATLTSDNILSATGLASSDFTGVSKNICSGFQNSCIASKDDKWRKFWATIIAGIGNAATKTTNSLSASAAGDKTVNDVAWGVDSVSFLLNLIAMSINIDGIRKAPKNFYNASISGSTEKAASVMQVTPSKAKFIASLATWVTARLASLGLDDAATGAATTQANASKGEDFYKQKKEDGKEKESVGTAYADAEYAYQKEKAAYDAVMDVYNNSSEANKGETINNLYEKKKEEYKKAKEEYDKAKATYDKSKKTDEDKEAWAKAQAKFAKEEAEYEAIKKLYDNPNNRGKTLKQVYTDIKGDYKKAEEKYLGAKELYDHSSDKNEKLETAYEDFQNYQKDYQSMNNQAAGRKAAIQQATALMPDITALVVLLLGKAPPDNQVGGVSVSSKEKNINLDAAQTISMHSGAGIYLNTDRNIKTDPVTQSPTPGAWGIGDDKVVDNNTISSITPFVAVNTTNRYVKAVNNKEKYIFSNLAAGLHTIKHTDGHDYIAVCKDTTKIHAQNITLETNTADTKPSVTIQPNFIKLDANQNIGISIDKEHSILSLRNQDTHLGLGNDGSILIHSKNGADISLDDSLTLNPHGGNVTIDKIRVKNAELTATDDGIITLGGQVKIMGTNSLAGKNLSSKLTKLNTIVQKQAEAIKAAQNAAEAAKKQAEALAEAAAKAAREAQEAREAAEIAQQWSYE